MPKSVFTAEYASVVERLVQLRTAAGITQAALAERLGKPQSFVAKMEQGSRRLDVVEFYAVCRALGADPALIYADLVSGFPATVDI